MKVNIDRDSWYVAYISDDNKHPTIEIDENTFARWLKAFDDFKNVQKEIEKKLYE